MSRFFAVFFAISFLALSASAVSCPDYCSNGKRYYDGVYRSGACQYSTTTCSYGCGNSTHCLVPICGNGRREGLEECDNGTLNSDSQPNGCRSDCTLHSCGDWTLDSDEECDEGSLNDDYRPDWCRTDCRNAYCGDGVIDYGEECDDGNTNDNDGCNANCISCMNPVDNLHITYDTKLCPGTFGIKDNGAVGVIIVEGMDFELDCNGAEIVGPGMSLPQNLPYQYPTGIGSHTAGTDRINLAADNLVATGQTTTLRTGFGILVKNAYNVKLKNCNVRDYKYGVVFQNTQKTRIEDSKIINNTHGIELQSGSSENVVVSNRICGNDGDVSSDSSGNFGAGNFCDSAESTWGENGAGKCTYACSGALTTNGGCPTCGQSNCTQQQCPEQQECNCSEQEYDCSQCPQNEECNYTHGENGNCQQGCSLSDLINCILSWFKGF